MFAVATRAALAAYQPIISRFLIVGPESTRHWEYALLILTLGHAGIDPQHGPVADFGCGKGPIMIDLILRGYAVHGFDNLRAGDPGVADGFGFDPRFACDFGEIDPVYFQRDIADTRRPSNSYAATYCISVMEHVDTLEHRLAVLHEMVRVTQPGGLIFVTEDFVPQPGIMTWDYRQHIAGARAPLLEPVVHFPWIDEIAALPDVFYVQRDFGPATAIAYALVKRK